MGWTWVFIRTTLFFYEPAHYHTTPRISARYDVDKGSWEGEAREPSLKSFRIEQNVWKVQKMSIFFEFLICYRISDFLYFPQFWFSKFLIFCSSDFLDFWFSGFLFVWIFDFSNFWFSGFLNFWFFKLMFSGLNISKLLSNAVLKTEDQILKGMKVSRC